MALAIAILAAGKGTRLNSKRPKVLHAIGGKPLLLHVIHAAVQVVPARDVYVVIGHQAEEVRTIAAPTGVRFVQQQEQKGTGHAIQQTLTALRDYDQVLVLSGDVPLLRAETIRELRDFHIRERAAMSILSAEVDAPLGYGRILRSKPGEPEVNAIIEQRALRDDQRELREINSGIYAFKIEHLMSHIDRLEADNAHGELYLTDMAKLLHKEGERVVAMRANTSGEILGANTIAEMMALDTSLRRQTAELHMAEGVTIFQPHTVFIDADVAIQPDTVIEPHVQLLGATSIGAGSRIRSFSVLENAMIGDQVTIRQGCVISDSQVRTGAIIGPYAHIRPGSLVEENAHVGNFVELKHTHLGAGAKANHLAYLGDTEIGAGANIGAGTIVCNFDGQAKHATRIGEQAFIGSNAVLVAPVSVGEGAYVAAASCITQDVPEQALALGRARQINKPGWVRDRRTSNAPAGDKLHGD